MMRDHSCGKLTAEEVGMEVLLCGWVKRNRNLGGIIFVDMWDRGGLVQVVFNPALPKEIYEQAVALRAEDVIQVRGKVNGRPEKDRNPDMETGDIEVVASSLKLLADSATPPFELTGDEEVSEELRLKYRYLDLRRPRLQRNIIFRHSVVKAIRDYLSEVGFVEIETPVLMKSTPEGARDYLVPSRIYPGSFYALPQSPQMYKQLLMMAGFDRYFQIARCFRDEDSRADRQAEFTQLDLEASFAEEEDIYTLMEGMLGYIFEECMQLQLEIPFPRMSFDQAMAKYGTDKPDLRFGLDLWDGTDALAGASADFIKKIIADQGVFVGLTLPGGAKISRKEQDSLEQTAKQLGASGLVQLKLKEGKLEGAVGKFIPEGAKEKLIAKAKAGEGDLLVVVGGEKTATRGIMGELRRHLGYKLDLIKAQDYQWLWVTDFPLFEEIEGKIQSPHHAFTAPQEKDIPLLDSDPLKVHARHYDIVLNGAELGSGSVRIHDVALQRKIFKLLGYSAADVEERFGFFLKAMEFGCPPHAGIAPGIDRLVTVLLGESSIREVIAFPKTLRAASLMDGSPSPVDPAQLEELSIRIKPKP
jgi:aspartyl-tRNA synthetase